MPRFVDLALLVLPMVSAGCAVHLLSGSNPGVMRGDRPGRTAIVQVVEHVAPANERGVTPSRVILSHQSRTILTTGILNPDVYRVLSVNYSTPVTNKTAIVIGTDWGGNHIADTFMIGGTPATTAFGVKPFKTVTKIIFPKMDSGGITGTAGTTPILGLYAPLGGTADFLFQAKKASAASSFTIGTTGLIDETYGTINVGAIAANDSFEFTYTSGQ